MTNDWWSHPPSRPLRVDGGIKARSRRGAIARTWWSSRFIEVLESIGVGGRLGRGRNYARAGQVLSLQVDVGTVTGTVQGSRPRPYRVRIGLVPFGKAEWARIEQALADDAWYAAKLLAGEMPTEIEELFDSVGLALFPTAAGDVSMDCTCPDHEVPCKHLAAVCYLLAESFDADPFALLALRGRERAELLDNVRARRSGRGARSTDPPALAECLGDFFSSPVRPGPAGGPAAASHAVLDELPPVGVTVRGQNLVELLRPVYRALADKDP